MSDKPIVARINLKTKDGVECFLVEVNGTISYFAKRPVNGGPGDMPMEPWTLYRYDDEAGHKMVDKDPLAFDLLANIEDGAYDQEWADLVESIGNLPDVTNDSDTGNLDVV